jgi:hypothetical protein
VSTSIQTSCLCAYNSDLAFMKCEADATILDVCWPYGSNRQKPCPKSSATSIGLRSRTLATVAERISHRHPALTVAGITRRPVSPVKPKSVGVHVWMSGASVGRKRRVGSIPPRTGTSTHKTVASLKTFVTFV